MRAERVSERGQIGGQGLLLQVGPIGGGNAVQGDPVAEPFKGDGVLVTEPRIVEQPGDDRDPRYGRAGRLGDGGFQYVGDVAAGVGGESKSNRRRLHAAAKRQMQYKQAFPCQRAVNG